MASKGKRPAYTSSVETGASSEIGSAPGGCGGARVATRNVTRPAGPELAALADWTRTRAKSFKVVSEKRDADGPTTDRALEIVRRFISERGLILYGGLAIDYALRLRGASIYPEHARPDYDFFSPRSVDDAYDLAEILHREGFPNVGAHTALHVQTMRVKYDFVFVADISYAPPEVFERLPTFDYGGIRVLHPDYQRLDMHLAFCFPYSSPPREDIFHRFRKDLSRFNLFEEFYPLDPAGPIGTSPTSEAGPRFAGGAPSDDGASHAVAATVDLERVALHGFAAYGLVRQALTALAAAASQVGVPVPDAARPGLAAPSVSVSVVSAAGSAAAGCENRPARVEVAVPAGPSPTLSFATPWPRLVAKDLEVVGGAAGAVEWFDPVMDSRPVMGRLPASRGGAIEIYSTERRLLSVFRTRAPSKKKGGGAGIAVFVVTPQYLLLDLLHRAHSSPPNSAARRAYLAFYRHTLDILAAGEAYAEAVRVPGAFDDAYRWFIGAGPFGFPATTLGATNHDPAYLARLSKSTRALREPPPAGYDPAGLPPGYYFNRGKERPTFPDYSANAAYRRAGARRDCPPT